MNQKQEAVLQQNEFLRSVTACTIAVEDAVAEGDLAQADLQLGFLISYIHGACAGAVCFGEDLSITYPAFFAAWDSVFTSVDRLGQQPGRAGAKQDAKLILALMAKLRAATLQEGVYCSGCGNLLVQGQNCSTLTCH